MRSRSALLCVSLVLVSAFVDLEAKKNFDQQTQDAISNGLDMGEKIADGLSKFGDTKTSKFFGGMEKLSGFLGAAGGLVSFIMIFLPKADSAELTFMKEQFSVVNMKLDIITEELDNIKDLITLENQKSEYITAANAILFGFQEMNVTMEEMIKVTCSDEDDCLRKRLKVAESHIKHLDIKAQMHAILHGTAKPVSVFGTPLLDLIKITYKCDTGKIDRFANGVLKLALKGQQVIMTHEKLTGTSTSVLASMKTWLEMVYVVRRKANTVRNDCFNNIKGYMLTDIKHMKYQLNYGDNRGATDAVKRDLSSKYPWLHWLVFAYTTDDDDKDEHAWGNKEGNFWNIPAKPKDRKRNIMVAPQAKGKYVGQYGLFSRQLELVAYKGFNIGYWYSPPTADELYKKFERDLKTYGVWDLLKSFTLLRGKKYRDLKVAVDANHGLYWYNEDVAVSLHGTNLLGIHTTIVVRMRVIAVFRSREEIESTKCGNTCNGHGVCKMLPYSTEAICECEDYYQGESCESRLRTKLAGDIEKMLAVTFTLPKLSDVYFEIKDLGLFLGSSIDKVLDAASKLGNQVQKSFSSLNEKLTQEFRWANLISIYSDTITDLTYSVDKIPNLAAYDEQGCVGAVAERLAKKVPRWLDDLNYLIVGRTDVLIRHKSIILMLIDKHKDKACTADYKNNIDTTWKQLVLLQYQASMLLVQLRDVLGQDAYRVVESYESTLNKQTQFLSQHTCQLEITDSINVHCNGGFYAYPGLSVQTKCPTDYFVSGKLAASCPNNPSGCSACSCYEEGSIGSECVDLSGKCACKSGFRGRMCMGRDCQYDSWQAWGSCPCGDGSQTRTRAIAVQQQGHGNPCTGKATETRSCFERCCSGQFRCGGVCMIDSKRCDYFKDCADDEQNCDDRCRDEHTEYSEHGGGDSGHGRLVYLDRHRVNCGHPSTHVVRSFRLQSSHTEVRYNFKCCTLLKHICGPQNRVATPYTPDATGDNGKFYYLDRQNVECQDGLINDFYIERRFSTRDLRYIIYCCKLNYPYRTTVDCSEYSNQFTDDGGGNLRWLDRQDVACPEKTYLRSFKLERQTSGNKVRYRFKCCGIRVT